MSLALNRRSHLINPDTRLVLVIAALITTGLGVVSFLGSAAGLMGVAPSSLREVGQSWAVPLAVDGAIVVYTLAIMVKRRRAERAAFAWVALLAFTAFSATVNAVHAWETSSQGTEGLLEACVAAVLPLATFAATHTLADLIVDPEPEAVEAPVEALEVVLEAEPHVEVVEAPSEPEAPAEPKRLRPRAERDALILTHAAEGLGPRAIARETGVPKSTVARVLNNRG